MIPELLPTQIAAYDRWKRDLRRALGQYQRWLDGCRLGAPDVDLRIIDCLETLDSDRLVVAFVGEFSRGKTELINALFFADYRRRLLPTEAGRTTMCPTELFHDPDQPEPYLKLLPIETRLKNTSIAEYLQDPFAWNTIPLDPERPDRMADALREISRVRRATSAEARNLGLYDAAAHADLERRGVPVTHVEIPVWRYARISFPHPLLRQGLVVVDTPGLNALGSEPELTLGLLPKAHALIFVLAADTGVTRSDLELWQRHVRGYRYRKDGCLAVALNKIDSLWDELRDPEEVVMSIERQRRSVARQLGIGSHSVYPVSGQKALVGKIQNDARLLHASRLAELEAHLCTQILPARHEILQEHLARRMDELLGESRSALHARMADVRREAGELRALRGRSSDVVLHLMRRNREQQSAYLQYIQHFNQVRRELGDRGRTLMSILDLEAVDALIETTASDMKGSWTTPGLKRAMKTLFDALVGRMIRAAREAGTAERRAARTYEDFRRRLDCELPRPRVLSTQACLAELQQLHEEAEAFRNRLLTSMTEQGFVIRSFFQTLVTHARRLCLAAHEDADAWLHEALGPLVRRLREHKVTIDQRRTNLRKIQDSRQALDTRIEECEAHYLGLEGQISELDWIQNSLHRPLPGRVAAPPPAAAVSGAPMQGALAG